AERGWVMARGDCYHVIVLDRIDEVDVHHLQGLVVRCPAKATEGDAVRFVEELVREGDARVWKDAAEHGARPERHGDGWVIVYSEEGSEQSLSVTVDLLPGAHGVYKTATEAFMHTIRDTFSLQIDG